MNEENIQIRKQKIKDALRRGDIYNADLGDGIGSEQSGIRPVLIVQNDTGNKFSPTTIVAAITSQRAKAKLPTHIVVHKEDSGLPKDSMVLLEQVRTIDKGRLLCKIGHLDELQMKRVAKAMCVSLFIDCSDDLISFAV